MFTRRRFFSGGPTGLGNRFGRVWLLLVFSSMVMLGGFLSARASGEHIVYINVKSSINPAIRGYITNGLEEAARSGAACVILQLDTPGGLVTTTRDIVQEITNSRVPVVVYVAPSGARAASAGTMITMAAHVAVMAPGTNIGAAHPVGLGGKEADENMVKKAENDVAAFAKSIAEQRGRNVEWAIKAVRESESVSATKALELNVIDFIASDLDELIEKLEGMEVNTVSGVQKLAVKNLPVDRIDMGLRDKILDILANPEIAYLLLMGGLLGLSVELYHPGVIFPGVFGAICLVLALFGLQTLPVNYAGMLLILLGIVLFSAEMMVTSYGVLTIGGIVSMTFGSIMLFDSPEPYLRPSLTVILSAVLTVAAFFVFALSYALKAQMKKPTTGQEGLIGMRAKALSDIKPEGKVFVHGEYWNAESEEAIEKGEAVEVVAVSHLTLKVKRFQE